VSRLSCIDHDWPLLVRGFLLAVGELRLCVRFALRAQFVRWTFVDNCCFSRPRAELVAANIVDPTLASPSSETFVIWLIVVITINGGPPQVLEEIPFKDMQSCLAEKAARDSRKAVFYYPEVGSIERRLLCSESETPPPGVD
jgi:hypothetical protein